MGQQFVVENRAGAGTMIGIEAASRAAPDGYTLLMGLSTLAINSALYKKVPYDPVKDFAPITVAVSSGSIIVVHPSVPVKTLKELIAFARARPGQMNYASAGIGTYPHMTMELLLSMAKLKMVHIAYKGTGPAMVDMLAGHTAAMAGTMVTTVPQIRAGRLRALGVTTTSRNSAVPEIPTIAEAGLPGFESVQWYGLLAPAGTPKPLVERLNRELRAALADENVKKRIIDDGATPRPDTPEEYGAAIAADQKAWGGIVRKLGLRVE
jgi:tripartite-type tricarboxylate transporter receptor subunit TctC